MRLARPLVMLPAVFLLMIPLTVAAEESELERIEEELAEAEEAQEAVQERLETVGAEQEALRARVAELEDDAAAIEQQLVGLRDELAEVEDLIVLRIREAFKYGASLDPLSVFFGSDDPSAALTKVEIIDRVVSSDQVRTEELTAAQDRVEAGEELLAERTAELEEARQRQQELAEELEEEYEALAAIQDELSEEAQAERERIEEERRERERREQERRAAEAAEQQAEEEAAASSGGGSDSGSDGGSDGGSAPSASGARACPLDQPRHFIDSWGYPRGGGRAHRGTDIMGPLGTPVRAIVDGVWDIQSPGPNAGLWAILRGSDGNHYWYLHLNSHTVSDGSRVSAGQQVGTNGSTGNAVAGAEHIHFELHPGGGSAINPYPTLRQVCG